MAAEVKLPRLGQGMESGTIVKWLKGEGEAVTKGEPLYELDTDKVTQEVEAEAAGVLLKIAVAEGEVPVGTTIAVIGEPGEPVPEISAAGASEISSGNGKADVVAEPHLEQEAETPSPRASVQSPGGRVKASPLARRIARERGVELSSIVGTGPEGRIIAEDVERAASAPAARPAVVPVGEVERVPLTSIRKTIARRLTEAWTVPVFQLQVSADMEEANAVVAAARELHPEVKVSVTDLLTKICASALVRHPEVNVSFSDEALLRHPSANVGIAVAAPQGLVVPVVKGAERLSLAEIAAVRADLVDRARSQKLKGEDMAGRDVHDLEPGHVRRRVVHRRPQPAAGGDPRCRRHRGPAGRPRRGGRRPADDDDDAHRRSPRRGRRAGRRLPADRESNARTAWPSPVT